MIQALGFVAAFMTTCSFLPQAIKIIKTKDTSSISLIMYSMMTLGTLLWSIYGFINKDWAVFSANIITLSFAMIILVNTMKNKINIR